MGRIVCFGELLLRLTAPGRELLLQTGRLDVHVGGAEANVAVGLARLGHDDGDDQPRARQCARRRGGRPFAPLRRLDRRGGDRAGADGPLFPVAGRRAQGLGHRLRPRRKQLRPRRAGRFRLGDVARGRRPAAPSGITPALGKSSAEAAVEAAEAARAKGILVSFDGNYRAQLWERWDSDPKKVLGRLVGQADILFGNHRDISLLLGRAFSGEGEERRRRPRRRCSRNSRAEHDRLDRTPYRRRRHPSHLGADRSRDGSAQTGRSWSPASSTGSARATPSPPASSTACAGGSVSRDRAGRAGAHLPQAQLAGDASLFSQRDIEAFLAGELDVRR